MFCFLTKVYAASHFFFLFSSCWTFAFFLRDVVPFTAFYEASAFNADLSKWQTGNVINMGSSKCTIFSVLFSFQTKEYATWHFFFLFCCWTFAFFYGMLSHSQLFMKLLPSMQICPSGKRETSPIWDTVSVLFSRCCFLSKQEYTVHTSFLFLCCWNCRSLWMLWCTLIAAFYMGYTSVFNADLSKWDTREVTSMLNSKFNSRVLFRNKSIYGLILLLSILLLDVCFFLNGCCHYLIHV